MQRPKDGRDDDIEIAADRRVGRMARDLGDRVTPLIDDAATIHRHRGARARSSRLRSIHNLITVRANCRFTSRRFLRHFAGFEHQGCDIPESLNGSYSRFVSLISATFRDEPGGTKVSIPEPVTQSRRGRIRAKLFDYLALTKPRTIHLVVGVIPAILLADRGIMALLLILNTLIGAMLMTAGANTLNCVADADIDKLMKRTAGRPLARAAVSSRHALVFGLALSVGSFVWLWLTTNLLTGLVAVATIAFYVFVYTLLIKRRTSHNVVWGGAANGMPVLIGWSAVTGTIGWQALSDVRDYLFLDAAAQLGVGDAPQRRTTRPRVCRCCRPWRRNTTSPNRFSSTPG